jgi:hypothetical protein
MSANAVWRIRPLRAGAIAGIASLALHGDTLRRMKMPLNGGCS